ncbi:hypothetical protein G9X67_14795 [Rhizobium sp. WYCCWR 11152]|uniref:putative phage abortive infection protein n=1 Tax=Rhizobium sp. WYCCWR 11152 TaxID=2692316 RepID=UPI001491F70B|nr:putative phage abortive infection protein [Rhizobium sp. WYCCWR 11152]NNU66543.1 hypothetical protein [Rhizobium sp. WYCCWR 11152]
MGDKFVWRAGAAVFFLWLVWALHPLLAKRMLIEVDPATAGQWGDAFGALNALFSALAFVAVLFTLKQQRDDLAKQQEQIDAAQRDQHRQRFESSFFQLLRMIREGREQVLFRHSKSYRLMNPGTQPPLYSGHQAFRAAHQEMAFWIRREQSAGREVTRDTLAKIYAERIHSRHESTFGAYYRLVYGAFDRTRADKHLNSDEKDDFGNLIRSQFTSFEAAIAGCNALNGFAKDFDEIIIRFRLLKYARRGPVYDELQRHYPRLAFLGRDEAEEPVPDLEAEEEADHDEA